MQLLSPSQIIVLLLSVYFLDMYALLGQEIEFLKDSADLSLEGKKQLDKVLPFLLKNPTQVRTGK